MKPTLPNGQVPVLSVDGECISQSVAILKYAGILSGLYPKDPLEAARVDSAIMDIEEISFPLAFDLYRERHGMVGAWTPDEKKANRANLATVVFPRIFARWNGMLEGKEYLAN